MRVSVICTVLNEGESIRRLMDSLVAQSRQPDEIVIVDGGSRDNTVAVIQEYSDRLPLRGDVAALPERDHLLDDRPHLLRLRLGRPDAAVLDQRAGEVRVERLAVGRVPAQLPACAVVPHSATRP